MTWCPAARVASCSQLARQASKIHNLQLCRLWVLDNPRGNASGPSSFNVLFVVQSIKANWVPAKSTTSSPTHRPASAAILPVSCSPSVLSTCLYAMSCMLSFWSALCNVMHCHSCSSCSTGDRGTAQHDVRLHLRLRLVTGGEAAQPLRRHSL